MSRSLTKADAAPVDTTPGGRHTGWHLLAVACLAVCVGCCLVPGLSTIGEISCVTFLLIEASLGLLTVVK